MAEQSISMVKEHFFTGNFDKCIVACEKFHVGSNRNDTLNELYLYLSYLAERKYRFLNEQSARDPVAKKMTPLAKYLEKKCSAREALSMIESSETNAESADDQLLLKAAMTSLVHIIEHEWAAAYRAIRPLLSRAAGMSSFAVAVTLQVNRVLYAEQLLKSMRNSDEIGTLEQMAAAWIAVQKGGKELRTAEETFSDLIDRCGKTVLLLNSRAAVRMALAMYEEAEEDLNVALEMDSDDPITLANLMIVSKHLRKPDEVFERLQVKLKSLHPDFAMLAEIEQKRQEFQKLAAFYKPSKAASPSS